jgi:hypothetical protein
MLKKDPAAWLKGMDITPRVRLDCRERPMGVEI